MDRADLLNRLKNIEGEILFKNSVQEDGKLITKFHKLTNEKLIGPFCNPTYNVLDEEQYNKALELINNKTLEEFGEFDESIIELVKSGCKPGMPYVAVNGNERMLVDRILNEDSRNIEVWKWEELGNNELEYWSDKLDYLELAKTQK